MRGRRRQLPAVYGVREEGRHDKYGSAVWRWGRELKGQVGAQLRRLLTIGEDVLLSRLHIRKRTRWVHFVHRLGTTQTPETHYDDYDNVVVGVGGVKHFWVCGPETLGRTNRAGTGRVNERLDVTPTLNGDWHRLTIQAGSVLLLPRGWWHHVVTEPGAATVSTWLYPSRALSDNVFGGWEAVGEKDVMAVCGGPARSERLLARRRARESWLELEKKQRSRWAGRLRGGEGLSLRLRGGGPRAVKGRRAVTMATEESSIVEVEAVEVRGQLELEFALPVAGPAVPVDYQGFTGS